MEKVTTAPKKRFNWFKPALLLSVVTLVYFNVDFSILNHKSIDGKETILKELESNHAATWSKIYTNTSHLAGTNYELVDFTLQKFRQYGWDTEIDTYETLLSYPIDHSLKLVDDKKVIYMAPLKEDVLDDDPTTSGGVPTFLAYAANGNVTGDFIFANYATKEDFEKLKSNKVDVKGKIVIARYGKNFRGLKVKFAQEAGAIGVLLYTDPNDDTIQYPEHKQYPKGPARNPSSVQRGSTQFLGGIGATPGDPTTPGYASKLGVKRKDPYHSIGKIPALPISYREIKPILEKLKGKGEKLWENSLSAYTGPSKDFSLNLYNNQNFTITPIYNVYATIKGSSADTIIIGNHRDAWIKGGAGDPNSGSAVLLEVARALGKLKDSGYKFKKTIILQSYDGEEYGLLGSTESGEYFSKKYQKNVVAYFNLDSAVTGKHLNLAASPILNELLLKVAGEIEYPGKKSLLHHWGNNTINILGSGSDYTVFLEHLGIPSVDLGFSGGKDDPVYQYHSNYDSFHWMEKFGDPGFVYHNLIAKYLSLLIFELSEKELLNFSLSSYSHSLLDYYQRVLPLIPKKWLNSKIHQEDLNEFANDSNLGFIKQISNNIYGTFCAVYPELLKSFGCDYFSMKGSRHGHAKLDDEYSEFEGVEKMNIKSDDFDNIKVELAEKLNNVVSIEDAAHDVLAFAEKFTDPEFVEELGDKIVEFANEVYNLESIDEIIDEFKIDKRHGDYKERHGSHKGFDHEKHGDYRERHGSHKGFDHENHEHHDKHRGDNHDSHREHGKHGKHHDDIGKHHGGDKHGKHPHLPPHFSGPHSNTTVNDILKIFHHDLVQLHKSSIIFDQETKLLQDKYNNRNNLHWWQKIKLHFDIKHHNNLLKYYERNFLHKEGLHKRKWFKHIIFASGRYTGYAGQTFPGLREAIEDKKFRPFIHWLGIIGKSVRRINEGITR